MSHNSVRRLQRSFFYAKKDINYAFSLSSFPLLASSRWPLKFNIKFKRDQLQGSLFSSAKDGSIKTTLDLRRGAKNAVFFLLRMNLHFRIP